MAHCNHKRHGIVTNQDPTKPYDSSRAHASTTCCDREACIAAEIAWVAGKTNETATFYSDVDLRAARARRGLPRVTA